jgi:acyl-CoA thioesterase YciA
MLPRDTNARGTIFGGVILSHIDLAGAVAAARQAARNFVTRAMH